MDRKYSTRLHFETAHSLDEFDRSCGHAGVDIEIVHVGVGEVLASASIDSYNGATRKVEDLGCVGLVDDRHNEQLFGPKFLCAAFGIVNGLEEATVAGGVGASERRDGGDADIGESFGIRESYNPGLYVLVHTSRPWSRLRL